MDQDQGPLQTERRICFGGQGREWHRVQAPGRRTSHPEPVMSADSLPVTCERGSPDEDHLLLPLPLLLLLLGKQKGPQPEQSLACSRRVLVMKGARGRCSLSNLATPFGRLSRAPESGIEGWPSTR